MGIERQSYVIDYTKILVQYGMVIAIAIISLFTMRMEKMQTLKERITAATCMVAAYIGAAYVLQMPGLGLYTWGVIYTMIIYIIPTIILTFCDSAPAAHIGALAGYAAIVGFKTGTDTFWPFVITLLMLALHSTFTTPNDQKHLKSDLLFFIIGIAQAIGIMAIGA